MSCNSILVVKVINLFKSWDIIPVIVTDENRVIIHESPALFSKQQISELFSLGCNSDIINDIFFFDIAKEEDIMLKIQDLKEKLSIIQDTCCYSSVAIDYYNIEDMIRELENIRI